MVKMLLYTESYIASFCSFSCLDEVDVSKSKVGACSESAFFLCRELAAVTSECVRSRDKFSVK